MMVQSSAMTSFSSQQAAGTDKHTHKHWMYVCKYFIFRTKNEKFYQKSFDCFCVYTLIMNTNVLCTVMFDVKMVIVFQ